MIKYVAIPTGMYGKGGTYLDFWTIYIDNGGDYPRGAIRFNSLHANMERIKGILKRAKKDYVQDVQAFMDSRKYTPRRGDSSRQRLNTVIKKQMIESRCRSLGI